MCSIILIYWFAAHETFLIIMNVENLEMFLWQLAVKQYVDKTIYFAVNVYFK